MTIRGIVYTLIVIEVAVLAWLAVDRPLVGWMDNACLAPAATQVPQFAPPPPVDPVPYLHILNA